jgi:acetyl esterase/lipase
MMAMADEQRPPGPEVGEIIDGTLPGAAGDLDYRLYKPKEAGSRALVCYFHGGGWVLGSQVSDDPFCRDLCDRAGVNILSVNYRHGPEDRFPAAADDAFAALCWAADNAEALGAAPGQLVVAGWSAGGNIAAVAAQRARDAGGPGLAGMLLVTPVTDGSKAWPSMTENGEGYILTKSLMDWFWDNYADPAQRADPSASPLLADSLAGLPPAAIFTAEFDPLRDEGNAYAAALQDAGVPVQHVQCRGHTHTSLPAVGQILSGEQHREQMAEALRRFARLR